MSNYFFGFSSLLNNTNNNNISNSCTNTSKTTASIINVDIQNTNNMNYNTKINNNNDDNTVTDNISGSDSYYTIHEPDEQIDIIHTTSTSPTRTKKQFTSSSSSSSNQHRNSFNQHQQQQQQQSTGTNTNENSINDDDNYYYNTNDNNDFVDIVGIDIGQQPKNIYTFEYVQWQACKIITSRWYRRLRLISILTVCIALGIRTYEVNGTENISYTGEEQSLVSSSSSNYSAFTTFGINIANDIILFFQCMFVIELIIEISYYQNRLLYNGWLVMDCIILCIVWGCTILNGNLQTSSLLILRGFRIMRAMRKSSLLQLTVSSIGRSIPQLGTVLLLFSIQYYMFIVLFTDIFQNLYSDGILSQDYFGRLDITMITLFQIISGGIVWSTISDEILVVYPNGWILFVSYFLISVVLFGSITIAIVCNAVTQTYNEQIHKSLAYDYHITNHNNNNNHHHHLYTSHNGNSSTGNVGGGRGKNATSVLSSSTNATKTTTKSMSSTSKKNQSQLFGNDKHNSSINRRSLMRSILLQSGKNKRTADINNRSYVKGLSSLSSFKQSSSTSSPSSPLPHKKAKKIINEQIIQQRERELSMSYIPTTTSAVVVAGAGVSLSDAHCTASVSSTRPIVLSINDPLIQYNDGRSSIYFDNNKNNNSNCKFDQTDLSSSSFDWNDVILQHEKRLQEKQSTLHLQQQQQQNKDESIHIDTKILSDNDSTMNLVDSSTSTESSTTSVVGSLKQTASSMIRHTLGLPPPPSTSCSASSIFLQPTQNLAPIQHNSSLFSSSLSSSTSTQYKSFRTVDSTATGTISSSTSEENDTMKVRRLEEKIDKMTSLIGNLLVNQTSLQDTVQQLQKEIHQLNIHHSNIISIGTSTSTTATNNGTAIALAEASTTTTTVGLLHVEEQNDQLATAAAAVAVAVATTTTPRTAPGTTTAIVWQQKERKKDADIL